MRRIPFLIASVGAALAIALSAVPASANKPVSDGDAQKIRAAMEAWGCTGGKIEQETEATGVFEVDDSKCHGGQYDLKFDKDFKLISMTRD